MMKVAMSPAAASLLRALLARTGVDRNRIYLTDYRSVDWNSLTFDGERHEIGLRIPGPEAKDVAQRLLGGIGEDEFAIPGQVVADIGVDGALIEHPDGSITLSIEALTIAE